MDHVIEKMDINELYTFVDKKLHEEQILIDPSLEWNEMADKMEDEKPELAQYLRRAEARWLELEG